MPDWRAHLAQATHNEQFARSLVQSSNGPYDWAVTVTFYAALHHFDCWLLKTGVNVLQEAKAKNRSPHVIRGQKARDNLPPPMSAIYRTLRQQSELARYLTTTDQSNGQMSLPSPPPQYFTQTNTARFFTDLEALKAHFGNP
jgi:hypothetical protein